MSVFAGSDTLYQARAPLTSHAGVTATITRSAKPEGELHAAQLDINGSAFDTRKGCLGVLFCFRRVQPGRPV